MIFCFLVFSYQADYNFKFVSYVGLMSLTHHGGAIYYESSTCSSFFCESCLFYQCGTRNGYYGGAIYISNGNNGTVSFKKVCASECNSIGGENRYQFCFLTAYSMVDSTHSYVSVTKCTTTISENHYSWVIWNMKASCTNMNISDNRNYWVSTMSICLDNNPGSLSYSNFVNNAGSYICFSLEISQDYSLTYTNVIGNNSPQGEGVVRMRNLKNRMQYCCFKNNNNIVFCLVSANVEVRDCYILESSTSGSTIQFLSPTSNPSPLKLILFASAHCQAAHPLIESSFRYINEYQKIVFITYLLV